MNYIKDQKNLDGKIVLLRLDLNVPLKNGTITDDTRIVKILPTLEFLIKNNSKIIIISHIGRPKGEWNDIFSMKPVCEYINKKINSQVKLIKKNIFELKKEELFSNSKDQIVFLENIRFYKNEEENDMNFSKHLASLGDLFINDAFSCSHRAHASLCEITKYIPSYAGIQFEAEVNALEKVTKNIKKPITCIIGGSKISTKISIIKNLIPRFDNIIIVGGMANNLLKYKGHSIGNHSYDHTHINAMSKDRLIKSIAKSQLAFHEYVGVLPSFYRPPYGNITEVQEKILSKHFSHLIRWSIDPRDWDRNKSDDVVIEHILAKVTAGSIIVLHEKKRTVRLLPQLLEALHQRGYTMVSLDAAIAIAMD